MHNVTTHTDKLDLNKKDDLKKYDAILNDPSCTILREIREKITHKDVDDEGKISGYWEELILIVTWQKKSFLLE